MLALDVLMMFFSVILRKTSSRWKSCASFFWSSDFQALRQSLDHGRDLRSTYIKNLLRPGCEDSCSGTAISTFLMAEKSNWWPATSRRPGDVSDVGGWIISLVEVSCYIMEHIDENFGNILIFRFFLRKSWHNSNLFLLL